MSIIKTCEEQPAVVSLQKTEQKGKELHDSVSPGVTS